MGLQRLPLQRLPSVAEVTVADVAMQRLPSVSEVTIAEVTIRFVGYHCRG